MDGALGYDRNRKASLYATVGIADYWIVNLVDDQLEVYRQPIPDSSQAYCHGYGSRQILGKADVVAPLAPAGSSLAVGELLG